MSIIDLSSLLCVLSGNDEIGSSSAIEAVAQCS